MTELETTELETIELETAEVENAGRNRRAGFTLMEAVVALSILAVGLLAMLGMQLQAMRQSEWGRHTTEAGRIARDQLEMFNRLAWTDPQLQDTNWTALAPIDTTVQSTQGTLQEQRFNLQWRITTDGANANLRQIDVRILWTEKKQRAGSAPRRYAVSSMRYND
jgi:type IV pilus assembly protein PilV